MLSEIVSGLADFFSEFIPALKLESIIVGVGLILMSIYLWFMCNQSGLVGNLAYPVLHPGTSLFGIVAGLGLIVLALVLKPKRHGQTDL